MNKYTLIFIGLLLLVSHILPAQDWDFQVIENDGIQENLTNMLCIGSSVCNNFELDIYQSNQHFRNC